MECYLKSTKIPSVKNYIRRTYCPQNFVENKYTKNLNRILLSVLLAEENLTPPKKINKKLQPPSLSSSISPPVALFDDINLLFAISTKSPSEIIPSEISNSDRIFDEFISDQVSPD